MVGDRSITRACKDSDGAHGANRRRQFIIAATEAFYANGYGSTTMTSIASKVGGSKTTLWSYFPSKEALFAAVIDDIIETRGEALSIDFPEDEELRSFLARFGAVLMATLLSEPILNLHRLVIGEARRFPYLSKLFYERGPRWGKARLADYFARAMHQGRLRQGDPAVAAQQFAALCQAGTYQFAIMNLPIPDREAQVAADIEHAVEAFTRSWALG